MGAYTRRVLPQGTLPPSLSQDASAHFPRRRRPAAEPEHSRRVAWGRQWAEVGKEWKRLHNPKGR